MYISAFTSAHPIIYSCCCCVCIHFSLIYDSFVKRCACALCICLQYSRARLLQYSLCDCCPWSTTVNLSSFVSSIKCDCLHEATKRNAKIHEFVFLCLKFYWNLYFALLHCILLQLYLQEILVNRFSELKRKNSQEILTFWGYLLYNGHD